MSNLDHIELNHLITKDEINKLPLYGFEGKVHLVVNEASCKRAVEALSQEPVLGFDTETRPSFKKGERYDVSLLQLSTAKDAYLFRLNKIKFEGELVELLSNKNIIKTGVAIRDDIKALQKLTDFEAGSFVELADLAKSLGAKSFGLRSLAAVLFKKRISKNAKISNWEAGRLTDAQVQYAATDAWISLEIYQKLQSIKNS